MAEDSGLGKNQAVLEARGLAIDHGGQRVLNGLDLVVAPNEFLAVLGLGGSGKSQLFRVLTGLREARAGRVFWFGEELGALSERRRQRLRRSVGAVQQEGALFADLTVKENIMLPLVELTDHDKKHVETTVEFTLAAAGLLEHRDTYPAALADVAIRKAAVARALIMGPRLLICDDVFAGLDRRAQRQINDYLRAMHVLRAMATVILTHNVRLALELADRVAVLAAGRIVASGTPREIRGSGMPEVQDVLQDDPKPAGG